MDSFPDGFGWRTNSLGSGDWIVLRSGEGASGTRFELYLEYESATVMHTCMMPLDDFATGGSDVSPPTGANGFGSYAIGKGIVSGDAQLIDFTGYSTSANYSVVADECMVALLADNGTTPYWIYAGELDAARDNGTPPDDRPFVIYDNCGYIRCCGGDCFWNRLSPVDDATGLTYGYCTELGSASVYIYRSGNEASLLGVWSVAPVGIYFNDASHRHLAGWLRNIGQISGDLGASGTLASKAWMYRGTTSGYAGVAFKWDGSTSYP